MARKHTLIATLALAITALFVLAFLTATPRVLAQTMPESSPLYCVDTNDNGIIDIDEALNVIDAYFSETPMVKPPTTPPTSPGPTPFIEDVRPSVIKVNTTGGQGSGVIFKVENGIAWAATNEHVVPNTLTATVTVNDVTEIQATVVGVDVQRDLAALRFTCPNCQAASFDDSRSLNVGDPLIAVGYPLDNYQPLVVVEPPDRVIIPGAASVTQGIVSAFRYDSTLDVEYVQTDTPINRGNSGGPLFSPEGSVIGLNTWGFRNTEGMGYAILETTIQKQLPRLTSGNSPPQIQQKSPQLQTSLLAGPLSGHFHHRLNNKVRTMDTGVTASDASIAALFYNPYDAASGLFAYGFRLRENIQGSLNFVIDSQGGWTVRQRYYDGTPARIIARGTATNLRTQDGYLNALVVVVLGNLAAFSLNGQNLETPSGQEIFNIGTGSGYISIMDGYWTGSSQQGAITHYDNLRVWGHLQINPTSAADPAAESQRAWELLQQYTSQRQTHSKH
ncbi:MAG: trypsin-like peptidase domain-containing protein [Chloroflexota bacterium]|nr:trypsin-like peptidase domain-containing protein [Chloroflexota bacterium]